MAVAGGQLGAMRHSRRQRRLARHDKERPAVVEAGTVQGVASGCGAVYDARRLVGGGRQCNGPTCRQRFGSGGASVRQPWTRRW
uniref:Uncharacterized protein n=1 Tax=Oryza meridionalis TaxID=40149 RepID=A0A0E0F924_9ORYZ